MSRSKEGLKRVTDVTRGRSWDVTLSMFSQFFYHTLFFFLSYTSWVARRCPDLYNNPAPSAPAPLPRPHRSTPTILTTLRPVPTSPSRSITTILSPPRPVPGCPRSTCKVSALYLENCANALKQTDGRTGGRTDGRTGGRTDGQTDRQSSLLQVRAANIIFGVVRVDLILQCVSDIAG